MKNTNTQLIAICLVIIGLTTAVQARINFWSTDSDNADFGFDFLMPASANKHCSDVKTPLTNAEIDEIIRIHNEIRKEVSTEPLKWNCDLAKFSQNWANQDTNQHSTNEQREQIIKGGMAGENLSHSSETKETMSELNKGWIDEKQFWNNNTNTCVAGKVCGHYTQMVWKTTKEIGCGIIRHSKKEGATAGSYLVCTYYPGGNMEGEKPY